MMCLPCGGERVVLSMKTVVLMLLCCFAFVLPAWADSAQDDYLIGVDDVLKITVYDHADLDVVSRVSADGSVQIPLVGSVTLAGLTLKQAITEIQAQLMDGFLVNPQVTIFIEEYRSKKVMVIGHVIEPGVYELKGPTPLLELLSLAGGLRENAGDIATITRKSSNGEAAQQILQIDLKRLLETGDQALNVQIMDKDSVFIAKAKMIYMTGEVEKPDAYKFEDGTTILKAVSMAGGFTKIAAKSSIRIVRTVSGVETVMEDVSLQEQLRPDDVVVVPERYF